LNIAPRGKPLRWSIRISERCSRSAAGSRPLLERRDDQQRCAISRPAKETSARWLNAQGHILAELTTLALEDRLLLLGHAPVREQTAATLDKFIIMTTPRSPTRQPRPARSQSKALLRRRLCAISRRRSLGAAAARPLDASVKVADGEISCRVIRQCSSGFWRGVFIRREALAALWPALVRPCVRTVARPIGYRAPMRCDSKPVSLGSARDFDQRQIPHEAAIETTHISFTKGCYTGQEIVERVRSRGHVNRRLTGLALTAPRHRSPTQVAFRRR